MRDKLYRDFQNLGLNLHRYGVITDRTDLVKDGKNVTEFVIRLKDGTGDDDVWNVTMIDGVVRKIMLVEI